MLLWTHVTARIGLGHPAPGVFSIGCPLEGKRLTRAGRARCRSITVATCSASSVHSHKPDSKWPALANSIEDRGHRMWVCDCARTSSCAPHLLKIRKMGSYVRSLPNLRWPRTLGSPPVGALGQVLSRWKGIVTNFIFAMRLWSLAGAQGGPTWLHVAWTETVWDRCHCPKNPKKKTTRACSQRHEMAAEVAVAPGPSAGDAEFPPSLATATPPPATAACDRTSASGAAQVGMPARPHEHLSCERRGCEGGS
jgi:hypothetical protein